MHYVNWINKQNNKRPKLTKYEQKYVNFWYEREHNMISKEITFEDFLNGKEMK